MSTIIPVIIKNGDEVVKELAVFWNRTFTEFAIKKGNNSYLMISRKRFQEIIDDATEKGYDVFDYTDFYF